MTPELQDRWQRAAPPFDGRTFATCDEPTVSDVLDMLRFIVPSVAANSDRLFRFVDWHGHDGFITEPTLVDLATILLDLRSPETFIKSVSDDDYVLTAIYSDSYDWLLRYGITYSDGVSLENAWASVDLTIAAEHHPTQVIGLLRERWAGYLDEHTATAWFRNVYGG